MFNLWCSTIGCASASISPSSSLMSAKQQRPLHCSLPRILMQIVALVIMLSIYVRSYALRSFGAFSASLIATKTYKRNGTAHMMASTIAPTTNPLVVKGGLQKFSVILPSHVMEAAAVETDLNDLKEAFTKFESELDVSNSDFTKVVEKMETIEYPLSYSFGAVSHLMGVKNSPGLVIC